MEFGFENERRMPLRAARWAKSQSRQANLRNYSLDRQGDDNEHPTEGNGAASTRSATAFRAVMPRAASRVA